MNSDCSCQHPSPLHFAHKQPLTCFLTISLTFFSSIYSFRSSLMKSFIEVPRPRRGPSVSSVMVKVPPAADSQMYCSSSLCLVVTCTFSATRYDE